VVIELFSCTYERWVIGTLLLILPWF